MCRAWSTATEERPFSRGHPTALERRRFSSTPLVRVVVSGPAPAARRCCGFPRATALASDQIITLIGPPQCHGFSFVFFLCFVFFFLVAMRMGIFFQLPFVDTEMMCHWNDAIQQIFVSMSLIRSSVVYWDIFRFSSLKLDVSFIVFPWLRFGWRTFPVISVVSFFRTRFERVAEKIVFFSSVGRRWKISPARLSFRSDRPLGTESPTNEAALLDDRHISSRKIKKTERNFPSTRRYRAPSQRIEENRRRLGKLALNSLKKKTYIFHPNCLRLCPKMPRETAKKNWFQCRFKSKIQS